MDVEPEGSRQETVNKFMEICAVDREIAEASLTAANYNLETAVRIFLDGGNYQDEQLRNDVLNYGNEANLNGSVQNSIRPAHNQGTGFLDLILSYAMIPVRLFVWSITPIFDFFYSLFFGYENIAQPPRPMITDHERERDRQLRREQEEDYNRALEADRARVQERRRLESEQIENQRREEEQRLQEQQKEADLKARREEILKSLPNEPAETESNIVLIRLRFPNNEQKVRRFRMDEQITLLSNYVESLGFDMEAHRLWTSDVPRKMVDDSYTTKTFAEVGWRREQIIVDEI